MTRGGVLPPTTNGATTSYLYGLDLVSATDNNGVRTYLLQDGLGSTTGLTDGSGSVTGQGGIAGLFGSGPSFFGEVGAYGGTPGGAGTCSYVR